jgi:hypothetical protein
VKFVFSLPLLQNNNKHMKKELVIDAIKEFPQDFDLDILFEKLIFMEKVEKGLSQLEQDKTIPHGEVKEIIRKW